MEDYKDEVWDVPYEIRHRKLQQIYCFFLICLGLGLCALGVHLYLLEKSVGAVEDIPIPYVVELVHQVNQQELVEIAVENHVETVDKLVESIESGETRTVPTSYVYYDIPLSLSLQEYTQGLCDLYQVSYPLVLAIMNTESYFDSQVISGENTNGTTDWGIMQINSNNHSWLEEKLGITNWLDPVQNILAGVYILSLYSYLEQPQLMAMYYNSGPSGGQKNREQGYFTDYSCALMVALEDLEEALP